MNKYKEQVMVNATIASIADILMTVYDGGSTQPAMLSKKIRLAFIKKIKDVKEIPIPLEQFNVVFLNSDNLLFLR